MTEAEDALRAIVHGSLADEVETSTLDFKQQDLRSVGDTQNGVADAATCFANAGGGTVVLGVSDHIRGLSAITGTTLNATDLRRRVYEVTQPPLDVSVNEYWFEGTRLLIVTAQEGLDVYASRGRVPTRRFEDRCLPMTMAEVGQVHDERRGGDWSAVDSGRATTDADPEAILQLRALLRRVPATALRELSESPLDDILRALSIVRPEGTFTRAGELLLCSPPAGQEHELIVYQHRDTLGGEVKAGRRWSGSLLVAFTELMSVIEARIDTTPINLPSGQQIQIQDYPIPAVREAVANAVMHGDHRDRRPVQIEHSPEAFEVRSPGPLVAGVTPSNILTHPPKPRFPSLAEAMRSLGLAEKFGLGVDRMYREMIRSGRDVPSVSVTPGDDAETTIRFLGGPPNTRITKFISTLPDEEQNDTDTLLVVSVLTRKRTINAKQLATIVQRDAPAAQAVLNRLANGVSQIIEPTPRTIKRSHPDYCLRSGPIASLGPALQYRGRARIDSDGKIYAHVREYGSINNGTIQRLFDVDVYAARNILQTLVGREVLVRVTPASRGPSVKYGAGARFPGKKG